MINISVTEDGTVQYGEMTSKPDRLRLFTKHRYLHFNPHGGSVLIKDFLASVLSQEQLEEAVDYARSQAEKKMYHRNFYKKCGEFLGCTPKRAVKLWNAAEFYTKMQPRLDLIDLLGRGKGGRASERAFTDIVKSESLLREVLGDGLKNILPLVFYFKKTPQEMKKYLGKSLWKRLCRNSLHRNKLIVRNMVDRRNDSIWMFVTETAEMYKEILLDLEKIPSTLLANRVYMTFHIQLDKRDGYDFVIEKMMKIVPMKHVSFALIRLMRSKLNRIEDTYRMAKQLDEKFDIWKYTIDNFEVEHDRFTKMINERRYSPEDIEILSEIKARYFKVGRYEIELLDSRYKIHEEGKEMRHCVASYTDGVVNGNYLVYSIKKDGKRVSTLGVRKSHKSKTVAVAEPLTEEMARNNELSFKLEVNQVPVWDFSQHYGFANGKIENRIQVFLADLVISRLNGDVYVSDADLHQLEHHLNRFEGQVELFMTQESFPIDKLKFNPYSSDSYTSVHDYRYMSTGPKGERGVQGPVGAIGA